MTSVRTRLPLTDTASDERNNIEIKQADTVRSSHRGKCIASGERRKLKNIKIKHVNARSLNGKLDVIQVMMITEDIDILCVSETWFDSRIQSSYFNIPNYSLYRYDGVKNNRGSGSCIFVRDVYLASQILKTHKCEGIEMVWLKVQINKHKSFVVGSLYRHPSASPRETLEFIEQTFKTVSEIKKPFYVFGDLNVDQMN
jgi:hypothetical protein